MVTPGCSGRVFQPARPRSADVAGTAGAARTEVAQIPVIQRAGMSPGMSPAYAEPDTFLISPMVFSVPSGTSASCFPLLLASRAVPIQGLLHPPHHPHGCRGAFAFLALRRAVT